ncbi:MAG: lipid A-modifier LpxR family protein, partial [Bacteroidota bacterium]
TTFGLINSPFSSEMNGKLKLYIYYQNMFNVLAYDATLQGGLFNENSPYFIPSKSINRITFQQNYGIVLQIRKIYFEFGQSFISKEFKQGELAKWGGFKFGLKI